MAPILKIYEKFYLLHKQVIPTLCSHLKAELFSRVYGVITIHPAKLFKL